MFRSLYAKLAAVLLGLFILVGATFVLVSVYSTDMYQQEVNQKLNRELARLIVAEKLVMKDNQVNQSALKEIFHMLMVINPSIEVYLLDSEGHILAFSAEPGKVKRDKVAVEPITKFLEGSALFPLLGDDPREPGGTKVFTAARIPDEGRLEGYLYIILGGEIYDSVIQKLQGSYIFQLSLWAVLASLVVAVVAGLIIFACLTRRLGRLAIAMDIYKSGEGLDRLDLPMIREKNPVDEIDRLVLTFKEMAERIEEQVESLKKADAMRRELVANVSHDLRTPLSTLQGYMETLLMKDDALSPEEKRKYVEIAISHCTRLSKLVAGLFEVSKLEAPDTVVHREPFSLNELVQDIVQKFTLQAEGKRVGIHTNVGRELPFVHADIALIERAIENLLDNALRHTPEDGSVSVFLDHQNDFISVRISDTGVGIPQDELPRIFERFHQLDRSRKDKSGHTGLGLAITRRILQLHGSEITVASKMHAGTAFTFRLPVFQPGTEPPPVRRPF